LGGTPWLPPPARGRRPAAGKKPIVIGVSLLNLSNEFIVTLDQAIERRAKQLGVTLIATMPSATPRGRSSRSGLHRAESRCDHPQSLRGRGQFARGWTRRSAPESDHQCHSETRSAPTAFAGSRDEESRGWR